MSSIWNDKNFYSSSNIQQIFKCSEPIFETKQQFNTPLQIAATTSLPSYRQVPISPISSIRGLWIGLYC